MSVSIMILGVILGLGMIVLINMWHPINMEDIEEKLRIKYNKLLGQRELK